MDRSAGTPWWQHQDFAAEAGDGLMCITNGSTGVRATAGVVDLNGTEFAGTWAFKHWVGTIDGHVDLRANNRIDAIVLGEPGSGYHVSVYGPIAGCGGTQALRAPVVPGGRLTQLNGRHVLSIDGAFVAPPRRARLRRWRWAVRARATTRRAQGSWRFWPWSSRCAARPPSASARRAVGDRSTPGVRFPPERRVEELPWGARSSRWRWAAVLLTLCAGSAGWAAQALALLGPEGTLAPAPFEIAVARTDEGRFTAARAPTLTAEGAALTGARHEGTLWRWTVTPRPGAREVRLLARDGELTTSSRYEVGPPTDQVALTLTPAHPVKGRDREATLDVHLKTSAGTPDVEAPPPVLRANVGTLEALERVGPGAFRARYLLPATRYPEVVVLVAFSAWPSPASLEGAAGSLVVPLSTAIDLPGRTEPGAKMAIEIAGQTFGPVRASGDGHFQLPVVVPPGHRFGRGTVVDRIGNRRVEKVDLALPPTNPLACVMTPRTIPLGTGTARVLCATTDPYGVPVDAAAVTLTARRGHLTGPERAGRGLLEWRYRAPGAEVAPDYLEARWRRGGPLAKESLTVDLEQGPAQHLTLTTPEPLVFRGGSLPLELDARDALGLPRPGALPGGARQRGFVRTVEGARPWPLARALPTGGPGRGGGGAAHRGGVRPAGHRARGAASVAGGAGGPGRGGGSGRPARPVGAALESMVAR